MNTDTLALLLMMNLAGDHKLLEHVKQHLKKKKKKKCCHSSKTLWTVLNTNSFTMLIFPLTNLSDLLSGMAVVIYYLTNLILFKEELHN